MRSGTLVFVILFLLSYPARAGRLSMRLVAEKLAIQGDFPFKAGSPLIINGMDGSGKPYTFEVESREQGGKLALLQFKLDRDGHSQGGKIVARIGQRVSLTTSVANQGRLKDERGRVEFACRVSD